MPYEMMLGLKKHVPTVMEMVSDPAVRTYNKLNRDARSLKGSFKKATKQGKEMFKKAVENLAAVSPSDLMPTVIDKTLVILKEYQKKVELVLDAVVKFLKQTKFQIPGYEQRLSGLEIHQKLSMFVADVFQEAVEKIPEYIASMFAPFVDQFKAIKFHFPGSNRIVSGAEILNNLMEYLKKMQEQVIVTVRNLSAIQLEDEIKQFSAFMQFIVEQSENFLQRLKQENLEGIYNFLDDLYKNPKIPEQIKDVHRIIVEFLRYVIDKLYQLTTLSPYASTEQFRTDVQSWTDSSVKGINTFHNTVIRTLQEKSKGVESYVKVDDRRIEVEIPLPNIARFN